MEKYELSFKKFFLQSSIITSGFFTAFLFIFVIVFFPACADKMSVEEAKKITVTMGGQSFIPPPRSIEDIMILLDQPNQTDITIGEKFRVKADKLPPEKADTLSLANFYFSRGEAAMKMGRWKQAIEDLRAALRYSDPNPRLLQYLGTAEYVGGNFKRGIELLEQSLAMKEHHGTYAQLVKLYARVGDLESAKKLKVWGINSCNEQGWSEWSTLNAARMEGNILEAEGKFAEAEKYVRKVVDICSKPWVKAQAPIASPSNRARLARNLIQQGRLFEAEFEARLALKESLELTGKYSECGLLTIAEIGEILQRQGRLREAERLLRASIRIIEDSGISLDSYVMGQVRMKLGNVLTESSDYIEAMKQFNLAKEDLQENHYLYERFFTRNPNLMLTLLKTNHIEEAMRLISTVYESNRKCFGEEHYLTAEILGLRGVGNVNMKQSKHALIDFSEAVPILLHKSSSDYTIENTGKLLKTIIETYMGLLAQIHENQLENVDGIDAPAEALKLADFLGGRTVQKAIRASSARVAVVNPDLTDLVRKQQDAFKQMQVLQVALNNIIAASSDHQLPVAIKDLRNKIESLSNAHDVLFDEIGARFPKYSNFTNPQTVKVDKVQELLSPNEALVSIYTAEHCTYIWVIPNNGEIRFSPIPIDKEEMSQIVVNLRKALDSKPETFGDIPEFDLGIAYDLYSRLLMPVKKHWKGVTDLLIVAYGPLGQLPFSVLPTSLVKLGKEQNELFSNYRQVPWLIRKVSITRLPSVSSLVALRTIPKGDPSRKAFVGFGDPFFNQKQLTQAQKEKVSNKVSVASQGGSLNIRGIRLTETGNLDSNTIISSHLGLLNRLPDTAEEIKSIAKALDADLTKDIFLGEKATENQIKTMELSNRQVIAFATHALLPGDLDGLDQPALALCSPSVTVDDEDGLLTMGEIMRLEMNADWVVLSACNTGAAHGAGAEAVSGLGRAFFYAGTRAILVSMWPVETTSARKLTSRLFQYQKEGNEISRARALRKSMLELIDKSGLKDNATGKIVASYAHPLFWAPFTLVGDSGLDFD